MSERKTEPAPKGDIPIPYPTLEQGAHSASHLARAALGQEQAGTNEMLANGWVASGALLGQVFPVDGGMRGDPIPALTSEQTETLKQFVAVRGTAEASVFDGLDKKELLKMFLQMLLQLLGCVALLLAIPAILSAAGPAGQSPMPPQDMLAALVRPTGPALERFVSDDPFAASNRTARSTARPDGKRNCPQGCPGGQNCACAYCPDCGARTVPARPQNASAQPTTKTKLCDCSPFCSCGCQDGGPCRCSTLPQTQPIAAPTAYFGATYPPASMFAGPAFGGFGGFGGGRCGPGGCR